MRRVLFLLGELNDQDIEWMIAAGRRQQVAAGEMLIREGQPIPALYIILAGALSVFTQGSGDQAIAQLVAGDVAGEMSLVDARPPSATVQAIQDSTVLAIPRSTLQTRLGQDVSFAARFFKAIAIFLSQRLRDTEYQLGRYEHTENLSDPDELDPNVLDVVDQAGRRFERLLQAVGELPT
ncbi:MAG: cyclic nucleotide-binding domain-containing protein [Anaerolineae bacterium]|nr:cyclic nucleotide-binding domain-containing protein [Anaerolineae bacterium]